jgi:hypothetical protein
MMFCLPYVFFFLFICDDGDVDLFHAVSRWDRHHHAIERTRVHGSQDSRGHPF